MLGSHRCPPKAMLGPSTDLSLVLNNIFLFLSVPYFPFSTLSDPASLPVPLGKCLPCLGHQLGRCFLSAPLDVTHLSGCSGGHCLGLGDSIQGIGNCGKQVRHSSFVRCFASTRRGRVGAVGLGLLLLERRGTDFALQRVLFGAWLWKAAPSRLKSKRRFAYFFKVICL